MKKFFTAVLEKLTSVAVKRLVVLAIAAATGAVMQECGVPQAVIDMTVNTVQTQGVEAPK